MKPFRVTITGRALDGRGIAVYGGRRVFVTQAWPGEEVVVRPDVVTKSRVDGRVARLVKASAERINHDCNHAFHCTGCVYLAVPPPRERALKHAQLRKTLAAALDMAESQVPLHDTLAPTPAFAYRHYAKQIFGISKRGPVLGSYVRGTHRVVDNSDCPVLVPQLARTFRQLQKLVAEMGLPVAQDQHLGLRYAVARCSSQTGEQLLVLVANSTDWDAIGRLARRVMDACEAVVGVTALHNPTSGNVLIAGNEAFHLGQPYITESLLGVQHRVGPRSFFQINPPAAETLFARALDAAGKGCHCVELFSGVGALTLPLARRFQRVSALEQAPESAAILRAAARDAPNSNIRVLCADAETGAAHLLQGNPDVVVADPPRRGMGQAVSRAIAASPSVHRLVILSCAPKSLERDLPPLFASGFRLRWIQPVEQFPRTSHVETVTCLERQI